MNEQEKETFAANDGKRISLGMPLVDFLFEARSIRAEILPQNESGWPATEQFLRRMIQVRIIL